MVHRASRSRGRCGWGLSAARVRPQITESSLKVFESPFQRKEKLPWSTREKGKRNREEKSQPPLKAMGAPVPPEWDLEKCSSESTRKHLDSLNFSNSPLQGLQKPGLGLRRVW